ncbi:hypothetical protein [Adhaeribacter soli]|uniref:Nucleotidyltransferase family protein n=1 Tax=Adhaeribacter soli TaxID=2607655 RepID=A0A5N1J7L7_9BACT|nr:hypothetical protein [Adhaeribacter soli]KAA9340711.1 hypothetical protein F0P94_04600 [Adhaeribacter soli]
MDKEVNIQVPALSLVENLLLAFHKQGIRYCHWKGNEHVGASMIGDSDLDILFDINQKPALEALLADLGFKKFNVIRQKQMKDVVDYIGLDTPSGRIVHVHSYFRLTVGKLFLKSYQINLEEKFLNTRIYNEQFGIYCSEPTLELLLLCFSEALSLRHRDVAKIYLSGKINYTGKTQREYTWLKKRTTDAKIKAVLQELLTDFRPVYDLVTGEFNRLQMRKLAHLLRKEFRNNHLYKPGIALMRRWYHEATVILARKLAQRFPYPFSTQRINPRGGVVVAINGKNCYEKTRILEDLKHTFRQKLDVYTLSVRHGKIRPDWEKEIRGIIGKMVASAPEKPQYQVYKKNFTVLQMTQVQSLKKNLKAWLLHQKKIRNLRYILKARQKGMFVICEHFPRTDNAEAAISNNGRDQLTKAGLSIKKQLFALAQHNPPDILIELVDEPLLKETMLPGGNSHELVVEKISEKGKVNSRNNTKTIIIDLNQPLAKTLSKIKKEIWNACP